MKVIISLVAAASLVIGAASVANARGGAGPAITPGSSINISHGQTVGPQTMNGGTLVNNGTIAGGSNTAITSTGPAPTSITNNGTITSSKSGINASGSPSTTFQNNGTVSVINQQTSNTGSANATIGTGISIHSGP